MKITAVILVKNEQENIIRCLKSVLWCDEVVIIDDNSTDKTLASVDVLNQGSKKIRVFQHSLENDFSRQRNYALEKASSEWILFVDADEEVTDGLRFEIQQRMQELNSIVGYSIPRIDILWGKRLFHGESGNTKLLRLGRRGFGLWRGKVHERWALQGRVGVLKNVLYHYPHQSIASFLTEINFYTDLRSEELYEKKIKAYWWTILLFPLAKFFVSIVVLRGFLDGIIGLIHAILMSFHSFLVRGKLWHLWKKR